MTPSCDYGWSALRPTPVAVPRQVIPVKGLSIEFAFRPFRHVPNGTFNRRIGLQDVWFVRMRWIWKLIPHPQVASNTNDEQPLALLGYPKVSCIEYFGVDFITGQPKSR